MSSFRKAHSISNELGEVLVTTAPINLTARQTDWVHGAAGTYSAYPNPAVAGRAYRVLEVGCTVQVAGTAAYTDNILVGTASDPDAFVLDTFADLPATTAVGETYSTSSGGASTWTIRPSGTGNVDTDGAPFLNVGEHIVFTAQANVANAPHVIFFARLAPVVSRDVFA